MTECYTNSSQSNGAFVPTRVGRLSWSSASPPPLFSPPPPRRYQSLTSTFSPAIAPVRHSQHPAEPQIAPNDTKLLRLFLSRIPSESGLHWSPTAPKRTLQPFHIRTTSRSTRALSRAPPSVLCLPPHLANSPPTSPSSNKRQQYVEFLRM